MTVLCLWQSSKILLGASSAVPAASLHCQQNGLQPPPAAGAWRAAGPQCSPPCWHHSTVPMVLHCAVWQCQAHELIALGHKAQGRLNSMAPGDHCGFALQARILNLGYDLHCVLLCPLVSFSVPANTFLGVVMKNQTEKTAFVCRSEAAGDAILDVLHTHWCLLGVQH